MRVRGAFMTLARWRHELEARGVINNDYKGYFLDETIEIVSFVYGMGITQTGNG